MRNGWKDRQTHRQTYNVFLILNYCDMNIRNHLFHLTLLFSIQLFILTTEDVLLFLMLLFYLLPVTKYIKKREGEPLHNIHTFIHTCTYMHVHTYILRHVHVHAHTWLFCKSDMGQLLLYLYMYLYLSIFFWVLDCTFTSIVSKYTVKAACVLVVNWNIIVIVHKYFLSTWLYFYFYCIESKYTVNAPLIVSHFLKDYLRSAIFLDRKDAN